MVPGRLREGVLLRGELWCSAFLSRARGEDVL